MRFFAISLLAILFLTSCANKNINDKKPNKTTISLKCEPNSNTDCYNDLNIDSKASLKKVCLHKIIDSTGYQKLILINDTSHALNLDMRLDTAFYNKLKKELQKSGIVIVEDCNSPYTLKIDYKITRFRGLYRPNFKWLNLKLDGNLIIKNINYSKTINVKTIANIKNMGLDADFDPYINLLVEKAAQKVTKQIIDF